MRLFDKIRIPEVPSSLQNWYSRIMRELDVERHARNAGRANLPHSDDIELDSTQRHIEGRFHHGMDQLTQAVASQIDDAAQMVEERHARSFDPSAPAENALLEVEALKARSEEGLIRAKDQESEAWRDRGHFQSEHSAALGGRNAQYPDAPFLTALWLLLVAAAETTVNAFIFAAVSEHGWVGGWMQALIFATTNVLVGTAIGFLALRNLEHVHTWRKCVGGLGLGLGIAFAVLWNLGVAHYRELISANPDVLNTEGFVDSSHDVFNRMTTDLFGIHSMPGWALFILGVLAFGFAAWKGHGALDDRYPGYGKVDRLFRRAEETYANKKNELKSGVAIPFVKERTVLDQRAHSNARVAADVSEIMKQARQRAREYRDSGIDLRRACHAALVRYREVNIQVRDPFAKPPRYFGIFPEFEVTLPDGAPLDSAIENTLQSLEDSGAMILAARKRLADAEQKAIAELDEFFPHVEQEAAKRRRAREAEKVSMSNRQRRADEPELTLLPPETV